MKSWLLIALLFVLNGAFAAPDALSYFDPEADLIYLLYTKDNPLTADIINPKDIDSVRNSHYNKNNGLRILVHGWGDTGTGGFNRAATAALLRNSDLNVLVIDWSKGGSTINYVAAVRRVPGIGRVIANFLDFLHVNGELNFDNVSMVGVSLGAHVIGVAGKQTTRGKIDTLFGLDPAGPLFSLDNSANRLTIGDANYVEIIHTNVGRFGLGGPTANVDVYVNGGTSQPGCIQQNCNHMRSASLYIESINSNQLVAQQCNTVTDAERLQCTGARPGLEIFGEPSNSRRNVSGIFSLRTFRSAPFGMGPNF